MLVAALIPLLAAGPGTLCDEADMLGHQANRAAESQRAASDGVHLPCADHAEQDSRRSPAGEVATSPEQAPPTPSAPCCSTGMTCSGAGLTAASVAIAPEQVVLAVRSTDPLRALHSTDPTLLKRPPRA